jgi:pimeloyl-ACP methyl ester carboxylesterase
MNALPISFVGSSFGGSVALLYLGLNPDVTVDRMVLVNPVIDYRTTFIDAELAWGSELFTKERVNALRSAGVARLTPHFCASAGLYDEMSLLDPYRFLRTTLTPTLLIHGDADSKVPVSAARRHTQALSGVKYVEVAGGEHGLDGDAASHVNELLVSWLKETG